MFRRFESRVTLVQLCGIVCRRCGLVLSRICALPGAFNIPTVPDDDPKVSPLALRAIIVVLATLALVAIYANVQRLRRDKIETVIVTPIATPSPSATPQ